MLQTLSWTGTALRLLDQTKLPAQSAYVDITDEQQAWDAIKRLVVRGAPAIGVAAAFGAYLGVRNFTDDDPSRFLQRLKSVCDYLGTSRPTAVNLFWALTRIQNVARQTIGTVGSSPPCHVVRDAQEAILTECLVMLEEDTQVCRAIGQHGVKLLRELTSSSGRDDTRPIEVLTHCNAGSLATVAFGTALAPIYVGLEQGMRFHVWADETRPLLQGSRITAYELQQNGVPVTVLCDNMAASLMSGSTSGGTKLDAVIVGADRIAANGDVANKIGTLGVAILAKHFGVPFLVAAPTSTIDLSCASGAAIPIEQRDASEVTRPFGGAQVAPDNVDVYNPAFDVTPADLVSAIITERGVARAPYPQSIPALSANPTQLV
jgi:methylthioribose-1-phosphate isomerase